MANRFPRSTFHGVDITSTVPEQWKLKNTIYSVENITKCLSYEDNFFDYIHQRFLILGLTRVEWINVSICSYLYVLPQC
jgi:hypothetical protein